MSDQILAQIIKAIPPALWPTVVVILALVFRKDIKDVLARLKRTKILGNEFELKDQVAKLELEVYKNSPTARPGDHAEDLAAPFSASDNPVANLVILSGAIDRELRKLLYITGWFNNAPVGNTVAAINSLISMGVLPENQKSNIDVFMDIRNKIVHGVESVDVETVKRVVDIGQTILNQIRSFPTEHHFVEHIGVQLFTDPQCTHPVEMGSGVILKSISPGKTSLTFRIFPTLKQYETTGFETTWEWSFQNTWRTCYYKDPVSGEHKLAWHSSAEFVGRDVETI